ncbi:hypothetical protein FGO68_gene16100 [Halteria grandinella]|uniref:Macro domain-containing protein n=1 Tax=Halteria grandinella TaxID=5974 RepID=A0A8J8NKC4_HALGN|nr:hypothetical protein FGO68_gene16100 [Halteria grandinella]
MLGGQGHITSKGVNAIIHTVGPYLDEQGHTKPLVLANCYRNSLKIALSLQADSIIFPSISTGYYGYPMLEAAEIAINTVTEVLAGASIVVYMAAYDDVNYQILSKVAGLI